jgi:hypothetical protein
MLVHILLRIHKYKHHKRILDKLIHSNIVMHDLQISDKGGCILRDAEIYTAEMNIVLRGILKG